ncbi:MAG: hypothetical protein KIT35_22025 [Piscinibacter sp.]|uniref:hypothetical protein n=1 Tax=Piscinibacter sp. TaxID=1903157 RepID=UPI002584356B|nr:hypothetical protein [Piscinibacter sp.]MCW5666519.1 hypothetical protein [Piscinibacter sp.]
MQIVDLEKARFVQTALASAIKSAETAGRTTVDLTDVLLGTDDAARALVQRFIEASNQADAAKG